MNPAPNLVLVGPMGAGKSSIGRRLADRFGLCFVDADREIELRTGATIPTIFECEGEAGFRAREAATLAELLGREGLVIATGASAASQNAIGTGVLGGMISATVLAILFVPVFFVFIMRWTGDKQPAPANPEAAPAPAE